MNSQLKYFIVIMFCFYEITIFSQKQWSLSDCIEHAKKYNIEVVKQKIQKEILDSDIKIAKGNYLPNAHFNTSQNFSFGNSFDISTGVGQRESSSNNFSLSSSLNIFNGFKNKHTLQKRKLLKEKLRLNIDRIRFDLGLNITNKYLLVLFNKEIVKMAKEQFRISQENYDRVKKLYNNALIGKKELLEIESTLASDEKEIVLAENNLSNSLIKLQELLGIKQIKNFDIKKIAVDNFQLRPKGSLEIAIDNNPEINILKLDIQIKNKNIELSRVNFYPKVDLNYSYRSNYFHVLGEDDVVFNHETKRNESNGFWKQLNNNKTHFASLSVTIPIFDRFLNKENHKKVKEELKISEVELQSRKQILRNKINTTENDIKTSKIALKVSKKVMQTQKQAFEISQSQYKNGNISNYEFLESKRKFIQNSSEYIKAKYDYYFKSKILEFYYLKQ